MVFRILTTRLHRFTRDFCVIDTAFELIKEVGKFETGFEELKRAAKVLDSVYNPDMIPQRDCRRSYGSLVTTLSSMLALSRVAVTKTRGTF